MSARLFFRFILIIILPGVLAFILTTLICSSQNTLAHNGRWISTKTTLQKPVSGAFTFLTTRQALAKNRLNLGAWHGYQEVIYKDPLSIKDISFDVYYPMPSYLTFIFNKDSSGFDGIRLSAHPIFKNIYLKSDETGQFLKKMNLPMDSLALHRWHHVAMVCEEGGLSLYVDRLLWGKIYSTCLSDRYLGFRSGKKDILVDNVVIHLKDSATTIHEDFSNRGRFITILGVIWIVGCLISFIYKGRELLGLQSLLILLCSLIYFFDNQFQALRYPIASSFKKQEEVYWKMAQRDRVCDLLRKQYNFSAQNDIDRILFIGSSQTWGAGVLKEEDNFVSHLEKHFNKRKFGNRAVSCINAGISGLDAPALFDLYEKEWINLAPEWVVINLSFNDRLDPKKFALSLKKFIHLNLVKGIKTIFVLEATSLEDEELTFPAYAAMKEVALNNNIPIIDMHQFLKGHYDDGFLWWDTVHLTTFGHKLLADTLAKELSKIINK